MYPVSACMLVNTLETGYRFKKTHKYVNTRSSADADKPHDAFRGLEVSEGHQTSYAYHSIS